MTTQRARRRPLPPRWRDDAAVVAIAERAAAAHEAARRVWADPLRAARQQLAAAEAGEAREAARAAVEAIEAAIRQAAAPPGAPSGALAAARRAIRAAQRREAVALLARQRAAAARVRRLVAALLEAATELAQCADRLREDFCPFSRDPLGERVPLAAQLVPSPTREAAQPLPPDLLARLRAWLDEAPPERRAAGEA